MPDVSAPVTAASLANYTTLRVGGPARRLITAVTTEQIVASVREATRSGEPTLILAGGSNVVVCDDGFPGTVILLRTAGLTAMEVPPGASVPPVPDDEYPSFVDLTVQAGVAWDAVVAAAVQADWAGIECLSGIPGSAGATPIQNVGAYGQDVAETITAVRVYDRVADEVLTLDAADCGFGYRNSIFKYSDRWVVLSVDFRLTRSALSTPIRYDELARALDVPVGDRAPLAEVREAVLGLRAGKGMVLDEGDPDTYSAGSFFTNPVLDAAGYRALVDRAGAEPPAWPEPDGTVKVSAAWLIDRAGFTKGYGHGDGVSISSKHTLALTNRGEGTATALLALAREIRDGVRAGFGVTLRPEPVLISCEL